MARGVDLRLRDGHCPYCQQILEGEPLSLCLHCATPYHASCCAALDVCAIFGCGSTRFRYVGVPATSTIAMPRAQPTRVRQRTRRIYRYEPPPRDGMPRWMVVGLVIAVVAFSQMVRVAMTVKTTCGPMNTQYERFDPAYLHTEDPIVYEPPEEVWHSADLEQMLRDREIQLDMPMLPGPLPPEPPRVEPPRIGPWQTPVVRPPSGLGY